jgi:TatD DNase family protein
MIDSHCHLDHCQDPVGAADPGLKAMISVGTSVARNDATLRLTETLPNVWAAVGIHPNSASDAAAEEVRLRVEDQARHARVVAIGETGFDTHWEDETLSSQRGAFDWQADLAARLDLPLILHVRDRQGSDDASREASRALRDAGHGKGVLHCFNGHEGLLETALALGWMVSFAGNLTYPSATNLRELAPQIPEDRLLVETDSPFLAPAPHRGKRNTPIWVRFTAERLAELRGASSDRIEALTDANAVRFYRLPL